MKAVQKGFKEFNVEFKLNDGHKWSCEKLAETDEIAREIAERRSPEMQLRNDMLSIRYRMEEFLLNQEIM